MWGLAGKVIGLLSALAANALLARLLSLDEMGGYTVLLTIVSGTGLVAMLGLPQAVVRRTAEYMALGEGARARAVIGSAFCRTVSACVIALLLCGVAAGSLLPLKILRLPQLGYLAWELGGCVMVFACQGILSAAFKGFREIGSAVIFGGVLQSVLYVTSLALVWVVAGEAYLDVVLLCWILSTLASLSLGCLLLRRRVSRLSGGESVVEGLGRDAFSLLLVSLVTMALTQSDIWILTAFRPVGELAQYGAALRLAQTIPFFLLITNAVVSPIIAQLRVSGRLEELESVLRNLTGFAFIPALALALSFFLFGSQLLGGLFGDRYREGAAALAVLAIGQLVSAWSGPCGLTLLMSGGQNWLTAITLLSSLASIGLSVLLVGRLGMTGVAIGSSAGLALQSVLKLLLVRRKFGIWTNLRLTFGRPGRHQLFPELPPR